MNKPLAGLPPSLRLKEPQTELTSLIPTERLQEISWQDFWRSHAPRGATVHPGIRKSRISWYQNRPKDFSSSCFLSTMHNCEPLPVVQHQTVSSEVLMVKSYRYQEIQPSLGCPEIRGSVAHPRALVGTIQASS